MVDFATWKNAVLGVGLDVDGAYGKQCVDVALSWAQTCFPGIHYSVLIPPVPSAKDMFNSANTAYFQQIVNDRANVNQLPQTGDIAVFAASPEAGYTSTFPNPDGHVGVVDHADTAYVYLIQQDGSDPKAVTQYKQRPWHYTRCIGWIRPKLNAVVVPAPTLGDGRIGKTLYLHGVPSWRVYRVGAEPVPKNAIGFLAPGRFHNGPGNQPGLTYRIEGVSQYPSTVTIRTDSFGLVDIFVDKDGEIL